MPFSSGFEIIVQKNQWVAEAEDFLVEQRISEALLCLKQQEKKRESLQIYVGQVFALLCLAPLLKSYADDQLA